MSVSVLSKRLLTPAVRTSSCLNLWRECYRNRSAQTLVVTITTLVPIVSAAQTVSPKQTAQPLYRQGVSLIQAGRLAEAQRILFEAHTLAPSDVPIAVTLGKLDSLLGRNADAVALFREAELQQPRNGDNQLNLAIALAAEGSLDQALQHATTAVRSLNGVAAPHHTRGKILDGLGRGDEAGTEFESALQIDPKDPLTLYDYAVLCESSSRFPREIELLRRLIVLQPEKAELHALLGRALSRAGEQEASRAEFREAIRLDPQNRLALYSLSRALSQDDPAESARLAARFQALRLSEEEMNKLRDQGNQGVIAMQAHDWPQAIAIFQGSLTSCAGCELEATFEKDLGLAQCQSGDTLAGAASLRRSLALNPVDLDIVRALEIADRANASQGK